MQGLREIAFAGPYVTGEPRRGRLAGLAALTAAVVGAVAFGVVSFPADTDGRSEAATPGTDAAEVERAYANLPLRFESNRGQTDAQVDFIARGAGYGLFLTPRESVLSLSAPAPGSDGTDQGNAAVVRMRLAGANPDPVAAGVDRLPGESNYLRGGDPAKSQTGVPGFAKVRYQEVYPGVDLLYYGKQGQLEYDFRVAPGADPSRIGLDFSGARSLRIDRQGNLNLLTNAGTVRHEKPVVYQLLAGKRRTVPASFVLGRDNRVGFRLGAYDRTKPLVIDPVVVYSTYLGGLSTDRGSGVAVDAAGSAYVTGSTTSPNFPTVNPIDAGPPQGDEDNDAFVTKLNPAGSALVYSTFLGGDGNDRATGIAVDSGGAAYVTGSTSSASFPTTPGALDTTCGDGTSCDDAFVSKLAPDGGSLVYSTFLGGSDFEEGFDIDVEGTNAYVTGLTNSATTFPLRDAAQSTFGGDIDGYVTKLNTAGTDTVYSTFLGGSGFDSGRGIAVDPSEGAYLTGETASSDFPVTAGSRDRRCGTDGTCNGGISDAFVTKYSPTGTLAYSTFLGGSDGEQGLSIDVGRDGADAGAAYVLGTTSSRDYTTTSTAHDRTCSGDFCADLFVTKLDAAGARLGYSTYLGGSNFERATEDNRMGIAVSSAGNAYVTASTESADFPIQRPVSPRLSSAGFKAFVTELNPAGSRLVFSTRLAGNSSSEGADVAVDQTSGDAYVVGTTRSTDFPTRNPLQGRNASTNLFQPDDAFVTKLSPDDPEAPYVTGVSPVGGDTGGGRAVEITGTGFSLATAVEFGGMPALRFDVVSDTKLVAISPPHGEGEAAVTVTSGGRTSPANPITEFAYGEGSWSSTAPLPTIGGDDSGFPPTLTLLKTGKVLAAGGLTREAELYDPRTGKWSATDPAPVSLFSHTATLLQSGKVLVVSPETALLYDPDSGTWKTTNRPTASDSGSTTTLLQEGKVLLVSGTTAELYDPATETWSATDGTVERTDGHTATRLRDGRVLIAGGTRDVAQLYDPGTRSFTDTGELTVSRESHTATLLPDGRVLVVGGSIFTADGLRSSAEIYDPATGEWTQTGSLSGFRSSHAAVLLPDGKVLITGGLAFRRSAPLANAELFDPALEDGAGGFKSAGLMNAYMSLPVATLLSSDPFSFAADPGVCGTHCGKVLVVEERQSTRPSAVELYAQPPRPSVPPPDSGGTPGTGPGTGPGAGALPAFGGCPILTANVIRGTAASNSITGTPTADRIFAGTGDDVVDALAGSDCVDLGTGDDRGQGGLGNDLVVGGLGADRISGSSGNDRLRGNGANDRIDAGRGNDRASGDAGNDVILGSFGNDRLHGVSGNDRLGGSRGRDRINGGAGRDLIAAGSSNDRVSGDRGNDRINGNSGNDVLKGNSGKDQIVGGTGRDVVSGGSGSDRIDVRDGQRDRVNCGRGRDTVIADPKDRVSDNCERILRKRA